MRDEKRKTEGKIKSLLPKGEEIKKFFENGKIEKKKKYQEKDTTERKNKIKNRKKRINYR